MNSLEDCALDSAGRLKLIDFGLSKLLGTNIWNPVGAAKVHPAKDLHHLWDARLLRTGGAVKSCERLAERQIISSGGHGFPVDWPLGLQIYVDRDRSS